MDKCNIRRRKGCVLKKSIPENHWGNFSKGYEKVPPIAFLRDISRRIKAIAAAHPMMDPTVQVSPYIANASVEFESSVMSPSDALITCTHPSVTITILESRAHRHVTIERAADRSEDDHHPKLGRETAIRCEQTSLKDNMTHNNEPEIATPRRPDRMTGFLPILLFVSVSVPT